MSKDCKVNLIVPVGSSVEGGKIMFWAFDPSCTRTYVVPENTRVDVIADTLLDFLGRESHENITIRWVLGDRRSEKISEYLKNKFDAARARREAEDDCTGN